MQSTLKESPIIAGVQIKIERGKTLSLDEGEEHSFLTD